MRAECPECSGTLGKYGCGSCGWKPSAREAKFNKACDTCGETFEFWTSLTLDDDGMRRCATCHVTYLKRFVSKPEDRCTEPGCSKTVREHIAEFKAYGTKITERLTRSTEEHWL